ncbi:hypothetical protein ABFY60_24820 [Lysinibacillus pakistanensis]
MRKRSDSNTRLSDQHHATVATLALRFRTKTSVGSKPSGGCHGFSKE